MSNHDYLKQGTRALHDAVEGSIDLGARFDSYTGRTELVSNTFRAQRDLADRIALRLCDEGRSWLARFEARAALLDASAFPERAYGAEPSSRTAPEAAGALYVLAGSTLGAEVIAKRLAAVDPDHPALAALSPPADASVFKPSDWPRFRAWLNGLPWDALDREYALDGARRAFHAFQERFVARQGTNG